MAYHDLSGVNTNAHLDLRQTSLAMQGIRVGQPQLHGEEAPGRLPREQRSGADYLADPAAGGVGPYVDLALRGCSKVIDGNVVPSRLDVYSQGTYVASPNEYHALIAIDEESLGDRTPFTVNSNLTCLKRVK